MVLRSLSSSKVCGEKTRLRCGVEGLEGATSADAGGDAVVEAGFDGAVAGFGEEFLNMLESDRLWPKAVRPVLVEDIWCVDQPVIVTNLVPSLVSDGGPYGGRPMTPSKNINLHHTHHGPQSGNPGHLNRRECSTTTDSTSIHERTRDNVHILGLHLGGIVKDHTRSWRALGGNRRRR